MAVEASNIKSEGASTPAQGAGGSPHASDVPPIPEIPPAPPTPPKVPGVGERLRVARERKGFSVLQVAERLHIDPQAVEHIETENFAPLGVPVYVRGHIRRYAELVGEQGTELQDMFSKAVKATQPDLRQVPKGEKPDESAKFIVPAIYGAVGLAVIGLTWWVLSLLGKATPTTVADTAPAQAPAVASASARTSPAAPAPAPPPASARAQSASVAPAAPAQPSVTVASQSAPASSVMASTLAPQVASAQSSASSSATAPTPPADIRPVSQETELVLRFNQDSFYEVVDASGRKLSDVGSMNTQKLVKGRAPLKVMLGNAPGVAVEINGRRTAIDTTADRKGEVHFTVLKDGRVKRGGG